MPDNGLPDEAIVNDFDSLHDGLTVALDWLVEAADIDRFSALSGDRNPLHMNPDFARSRGFTDRVAHGFLLAPRSRRWSA